MTVPLADLPETWRQKYPHTLLIESRAAELDAALVELRRQVEQRMGLPVEWSGKFPEGYFKGRNAALDEVLTLLTPTKETP